MSGTSKYTGTLIDPSTGIDLAGSHPLANLLKVATNRSLSVEARLLYVILCLMAWSKGRCWPGQEHQAAALGRSDRQVRRYHEELERAGILGIHRRPGQSSHYYPWALQRTPDARDLRAPDTRVRRTPKKELENVQNIVRVPPKTGNSHELHSTPHHENVNASQISHGSLPGETSPSKQVFPGPASHNSGIFGAYDHSGIPCLPASGLSPFVPTPRSDSASESTESAKKDPFSEFRHPPRHEASFNPVPTAPGQFHKPKAPLNPDHMFLVEEIERVTGDTWSRGHFLNLVRQIDEQTIWSALSITREKLALESGVNAGGYFTATVRALAGLQDLSPNRSCSPALPTRKIRKEPSRASKRISTPKHDLSAEIDPAGLVKGWKTLYEPGRIASVLFHVGRCLDGWDATAAWEMLTRERAGAPEPEVLDEFLDLAALKVRFQLGLTGKPVT